MLHRKGLSYAVTPLHLFWEKVRGEQEFFQSIATESITQILGRPKTRANLGQELSTNPEMYGGSGT
jgi:hypothetical protein